MKKLTMLILFLLIFGISLNAQTRIAVVPFTGGASGEGDTMARLLGSDLVRESGNAYRITPRTSAITAILNEQKFQRSGLTDADTIAEIGKMANAKYVVTGHIKKIGSKNLVVASMTEIETLQQTAGYFSYYDDLSEMIDLSKMAQTLITTTKNNAGRTSEILAVLPFEITVANQASLADAETLAQILACSIANSGKYKVVLRTTTIEQIMKEHKIQQSALTDSENVQRIGEALNANYVLAGFVSRMGNTTLMDAQILEVVSADQVGGNNVRYKNIDDGLDLMAELSTKLTGVQELTPPEIILSIQSKTDYSFKGTQKLAIISFAGTNLSKNEITSLTEIFTSELTSSVFRTDFVLVSGSLGAAYSKLNIQNPIKLDQKQASSIGKLWGANWVFYGTVSSRRDTITISFVDVKTSSAITVVSCKVDSLHNVSKSIASEMTRELVAIVRGYRK